MNKDNLILLAAAAVAYYIVTKPAAARTSAKAAPTTGDFSRLDRQMAAPDTVGALGEPVSFFAPAGYI